MENTEINKEKFFAQYWGQEVINVLMNDGKYEKVSLKSKIWPYNEKDHLVLKSLLKITKEEVIEACEIGYKLAFLGSNPSKKWNVEFSEKNFASVTCKGSHFSFEFDLEGCPFIDLRNDDELTNLMKNEAVIDYLRSKGYAVPYMGLEVEQLIKYGWLVLESN